MPPRHDGAPEPAEDLVAVAERRRDSFEQRFQIGDRGGTPGGDDAPMDLPDAGAGPAGRELVRDFLFEHGLREAESEPGGDRDAIMFRFLARYVVTFPEMEGDLLRMDVFRTLRGKAMRGGKSSMPDIWRGVQHQPLAEKSTLRFLRRYLPEGSPLRACTISEMARALRWFENVKDGKPRPDQRRIRNILRKYAGTLQAWGIEPAAKGKPGPKGGE